MTSKKLRALFLATLMVLSVFAGAVAFSGTASSHEGHSTNTTVQQDTPENTPENTNEQNTDGYLFLIFIGAAILLFMNP